MGHLQAIRCRRELLPGQGWALVRSLPSTHEYSSIGGTATSLSLGIWLLILSGRAGCNLAILAQAFLINFSQAA